MYTIWSLMNSTSGWYVCHKLLYFTGNEQFNLEGQNALHQFVQPVRKLTIKIQITCCRIFFVWSSWMHGVFFCCSSILGNYSEYYCMHIHTPMKRKGTPQSLSATVFSFTLNLHVCRNCYNVICRRASRLSVKGIHYFHNDSWPQPRDCHVTCWFSCTIYQPTVTTVENIDQLPAAKVRYVVSKAKIMFKKPVHALTSKVSACQYNQVLEIFRPLTMKRHVHQ